LGDKQVEGALVISLDENWQEIPKTEKTYQVDGICIAVGLTPLAGLATMVGCNMVYIPELGGLVPERKNGFCTSIPWIFISGDASGIEEASSAIVEGELTGLEAAASLGYLHPEMEKLKTELREDLRTLRSGPFGSKIRIGLQKVEVFNV
jgi:sarcosine oxidase subunit alpha